MVRNSLFIFSSENWAESKRFLLKLLLFSLPVLPGFLFVCIVLISSGEMTSVNRIIQRQLNQEPISFRMAYTDYTKEYKMKMIWKKKPKILVLGSSRVMGFRKELFTKASEEFYNGGGMINGVGRYPVIMKQISPEDLPEVVIFGLDFWNFQSQSRTVRAASFAGDEFRFPNLFQVFLVSWKEVFKDYAEKKFQLKQLIFKQKNEELREPIGMYAIARQAGFRNDGSYDYGPQKKGFVPKDLEMIHQMEEDTGSGQFVYAEDVYAEAEAVLADLLTWCEERGIHVVGYLPPVAHDIYEAFQNPEYAYIQKLPDVLSDAFEKRQFPFFNFHDLTLYGSDNHEMRDGTHSAEIVYLRFFIKMVEGDPVLEQYTDLEALRKKLRQIDEDKSK